MNRLTQQVMVATREQAQGSEQIVKAVENMNRMTQQVGTATTEQKKGGNLVVTAVESINRSSEEAATATATVAHAAAGLQQEARQLREAIAFFQEGAPAGSTTSEAAALLAARV
ncbi:Methyl-accepting chemotaxis protein (MCP) signaling domain protein [compost metagenome]